MSLGNTLDGEDYIFDECLVNNYILLGWGIILILVAARQLLISDCASMKRVIVWLSEVNTC